MNKRIQEIWKRIESWDAVSRQPSLGSHLNGPASEDVLDDLAATLGLALPGDYLDSLRLHDGTAVWSTKFMQGCLLSSAALLQELGDRRKIAGDLDHTDKCDGMPVDRSLQATGPVKNLFWSARWIPIHVTDWSVTCYDFDPAEGGRMAQIIEVAWAGGWVKVVADNYADFLDMCADRLPAMASP